jgi:uncharacterized protein (DUF362 family)
VRAMIELCYEAGAKRVRVADYTCDNPRSAFEVNGMKAAVAKTPAQLIAFADKKDFEERGVPQGKKLKKVAVAKEILDADVFINMPIAKSHGASKLTLGMKNHMGAIADRWYFHINGLHQCIADVATVLTPHLIVVDAQRLMVTNGPKGPGEVKIADTLIAGTDQVAVDSYAATLFGYRGEDIGYIKEAYNHGLGEINLDKVTITKVAV